MRLRGLVAALVLALGLAVALGVPAGARVRHACTATDRDFLNTAGTALGLERLADGLDPAALLEQRLTSAGAILKTAPTDPSLQRAQRLFADMLDAAGPSPRRAAAFAVAARTELVSSSVALQALGCNVDPLL